MNKLLLQVCMIALLGLLFVSASQAQMTITITSPKNGDVVSPCNDLVIPFEITTTTETIKEVRFYSNGAYKGLVRKAPWEYTFKNIQRGRYEFQALLKSVEGTEAWSEAIIVKAGSVSAGEKISNGSFDCAALAPWTLNVNSGSGAAATASIIEDTYFDDLNYLMVEITSGGSANWHVQFQQPVPVDSGHVYLISFLADSDVQKTIDVSMQENQDPWTVQFGTEVPIDGADLYGPFEFVASRTDPTNYIRFNIGNNTTTYYIDDIRIIDTSASSVKAKEIDFSGVVKEFELLDAYPNPFNMSTTIPISLSHEAEIRLDVYNMQGQLINTLAQGSFQPGVHKIMWDGMNAQQHIVPSGIYFYRLQILNNSDHPIQLSRKIVLVK
ncbi:MAG: T9SS C-terminal target domain-containing protein [Calditrichaeota bacterium]|nr:MAG: T9SS C-terminal target domain-containing protein [Calditrichota bacterium]